MPKTYIDKLAFIEIQDGRILETRSRGKDKWYIPGGKRQEGENDLVALTREIEEELKVKLHPETIVPFGIFEAQAHGMPEGTVVRMTCYTAKYTGALTPSAEIEEMDWFDYAKRNEVSPVDQLIFDDLRAMDLIEGSIEGKEAFIEAARKRRAEGFREGKSEIKNL